MQQAIAPEVLMRFRLSCWELEVNSDSDSDSDRTVTKPAGTCGTFRIVIPLNLSSSQQPDLKRMRTWCNRWGRVVSLRASHPGIPQDASHAQLEGNETSPPFHPHANRPERLTTRLPSVARQATHVCISKASSSSSQRMNVTSRSQSHKAAAGCKAVAEFLS
ncbi:hypothetical protein VOLCADRAFT_94898 [Volvox carteri f. nagariensis]|uniref:Uncharacterized protein n=1 Tax=Volvox carteri f. nagariensis TaxID=3068 RepID=D8U626_VOLCA|nr:uncharacterized protein VOLCADRAFT_94898 [Volvox carteri f. nagariensis]EFJ44865.1 hypothetical protein VOLCADRAFT_94898 [Volvox carteri f. nagariensis]|eukprot:XP_002954148.1 hypothetical protein VOLCADRAFT_94898 [Volvox carteri f. nagariensis]